MKVYVNHFAFVATVIHLYVLTINANVNISNFIKFWFLDTNAFFHIIDDRNVFVFFIFMFNRIVDDIDKNFKTKKYDFVRLFCKKSRLFTINNVFYVKNVFTIFCRSINFKLTTAFYSLSKTIFLLILMTSKLYFDVIYILYSWKIQLFVFRLISTFFVCDINVSII